jgi:hypothetical protein
MNPYVICMFAGLAGLLYAGDKLIGLRMRIRSSIRERLASRLRLG